MKLASRLAADTTVRWFHSENYTFLEDDHYFDPQHIERSSMRTRPDVRSY